MAINWKQVRTAAKRQDQQQIRGRTAAGVSAPQAQTQISSQGRIDWDAVRGNAQLLDQQQAQSQQRKNAYEEAYEKYKQAVATVQHDQQSGYRRTQELKWRQSTPYHDQLSGYKRTQQLKEGMRRASPEYQAAVKTTQQDQARGMQRTSQVLGQRIAQLEEEQADSHFRDYRYENGKAADAKGPAELQGEIEALKSRKKTIEQGVRTAQDMAALLPNESRILALAYAKNPWTEEQKQEADQYLQAGGSFSGLFGQEQNVFSFAPYREALSRGDTAAAQKWEEVYDLLYARRYSEQTALATGFYEGLGVISASQVMGKALGADMQNPAWEAYQKAYQRAQAEHPIFTGGARVAGSLVLMDGLREGVGAASGAALGGKAAGMSRVAQSALSMGQTALTFAAKDAIQNAGALAMGEKTGSAYAQDILVSGAGGAAGSIVSGLLSTGMASWLTKTKNMTLFGEFIRQSVSAFGFSGTSTLTDAALGSEKKSREEIATELGTAFLFSLINGYIGTMRSTGAASRAVEAKYEQIEQQFSAISQHVAGRQYTEKEYTQLIEDLRKNVQTLKQEVSGGYYAGQQKFVNQMVSALDRVDYNLVSMLPTLDTASASADFSSVSAGEAQKLLTEVSDALSGGASQNTSPTKPTPSTPAAPQPVTSSEEAFRLYNQAADARDAQAAAARQPEIMVPAAQPQPKSEGGTTDGRQQQAARISDGDAGRNAGQSTGGQAGAVAEGAGGTEKRSAAAQQVGAATQRQNYARNLRLPKVSPRELGIFSGVTSRTNTVFTREHWDAGMRSTAERVKETTGLETTYVLGALQIRNSQGGVSRAAGAFAGNRIIVQADNLRASIDQLADHETYHAIARDTPGLNSQIEDNIRSSLAPEDFDKIVEKYIIAQRGVNDVPENGTDLEFEEAMNSIKEEIFADAYAGINAFGAHAEQYQQTVRSNVAARHPSPTKEIVAQSAPPDKYSVVTLPDGKQFVRADRQVLYGQEPSSWRQQLEEYINGKIRKGENVTLIGADGDELVLTATSAGKLSSPYTNDGRTMSDDAYERKANAAAHIDELAQTSVRGKTVVADHSERHGSMADEGWNYRTAYFQDFDGKYYEVKISVAQSSNGKLIYNIGKMQERSIPQKISGSSSAGTGALRGDASQNFSKNQSPNAVTAYADKNAPTDDVSFTISIRNPEQKSQEKFSLLESAPEENTRRSEKISEPTIATQELKNTLLKMFAVPRSERTDVSRVIDYFAGRVYRNGELTQVDRDVFFARLYSSGAMTDSIDERLGAAPDIVGDGRISVDSELRRDLGEEWNELRKRAFSAGLYLVEDTDARSVETWVKDLAQTAPDVFGATDTSPRQALEQIIQAAEEAQDQNLTLSEYAMTLGGKGYVPQDEILDGMERQMDWALRTFAEKAKLEVRLRDDKSAAIASERARADARVSKATQRKPGAVDAMEARIDERLQKKDAAAAKTKEKLIDAMEARIDERLQKKDAAAAKTKEKLIDAMEARIDERLQKKDAAAAKTKEKLIDAMEARIDERLQRERAREANRRALERQDRKDMAARQKARKELQQLQQKTLKTLQWLNKNRSRAPEEFQDRFNEVLSDIDLYAVGAANEMQWSGKYNATWRDLAQMYQETKENDPNFLPSKELERIVSRLDDRKIEDLDLAALNNLYKTAVDLRTEFQNRKRVIGDLEDRVFEEVYADSVREISSASAGYTGKLADRWMNLEQLSAMNIFERMADWNPNSTWYGMAKQLEKGERGMITYMVRSAQMLTDFLTEHKDWVIRSDGQGKDAIWYEIKVPELLELGMGDKPIFGEEVSVWMTPSQKVHMYLESQNYDNLRHMAGGRTFPDKTLYSKGKRREAFAQGRTIRLAPETVKAIVKDLTPEEKGLADALSRYYNGYAKKEINRVSNILYGYDKAMGTNYAPIFTNSSFTKSEPGIYDATAESVGNLKVRQVSSNPSYNIGAYDAFERNVRQTARFVGMAVPARNWKTLLNWRGRTHSMRDTISTNWGDEMVHYIDDQITRLEAGTGGEKDIVTSVADAIFSTYISATFGFNPSIVLKQAGSIPLASAYLGTENIPSPKQIKAIDRDLISKYTAMLDYRMMGYATPETAQLKEHPTKLQDNKALNFTFGGGAITAMDGWAASVLWPWAENAVQREFPDLKPGTQEQILRGEDPFYQKVAELFDDAVARSQSTSDEMHQSRLRKSKSPLAKAATMFKSDSAQVYNTIRQAVGEARYYRRSGADAKTQRRANRRVAEAFISSIGGFAWAALVEFLMNLWKHRGRKYRDEDGNLTVFSFLKEFTMSMLGAVAGATSTGGEEVVDAIGGILNNERFYDLVETQSLEQINRLAELADTYGKDILSIAKDGADLIQNGGDVELYLKRHGNDILGGIKGLAKEVATYGYAIPASNLEAYLLGTVKWVSPKIGTAYEDAMQTAKKSLLSGLTGEALQTRIGHLFGVRDVDASTDTVQAIARLYEAGYSSAVPSDTPSSIDLDGTEQTLSAYQKQTYDIVWSSSVRDALNALTASSRFQSAGDEQQAKMITKLYSYAGEQAKDVLFDSYEPKAWAVRFKAYLDAGGPAADGFAALSYSSEVEGEKDLNGRTISGSARRKVMLYIDRTDMSDKQKDALLSAAGYDPNGTEPWNGMNYEGIETAVRTGSYGTQNMRQYFQTLIKEGVDKKDLSTAISQMFKDEYLRSERQERAKLKGRLINAFMCLGSTQNQATAKIDKWVKDQEEKEAQEK